MLAFELMWRHPVVLHSLQSCFAPRSFTSPEQHSSVRSGISSISRLFLFAPISLSFRSRRHLPSFSYRFRSISTHAYVCHVSRSLLSRSLRGRFIRFAPVSFSFVSRRFLASYSFRFHSDSRFDLRPGSCLACRLALRFACRLASRLASRLARRLAPRVASRPASH